MVTEWMRERYVRHDVWHAGFESPCLEEGRCEREWMHGGEMVERVPVSLKRAHPAANFMLGFDDDYLEACMGQGDGASEAVGAGADHIRVRGHDVSVFISSRSFVRGGRPRDGPWLRAS